MKGGCTVQYATASSTGQCIYVGNWKVVTYSIGYGGIQYGTVYDMTRV